MKCDICFTPIPVGKHKCPNCGYTIKTTKGIRSSTMGFDHIEEKTKIPFFDHIETNKKMPTFDYIKPEKKQYKEKENKGIKVVSILAILFLFAIPVFENLPTIIDHVRDFDIISFFSENNENFSSLDEFTIQYPLCDISDLQTRETKFIDLLNSQGLEIMDISYNFTMDKGERKQAKMMAYALDKNKNEWSFEYDQFSCVSIHFNTNDLSDYDLQNDIINNPLIEQVVDLGLGYHIDSDDFRYYLNLSLLNDETSYLINLMRITGNAYDGYLDIIVEKVDD